MKVNLLWKMFTLNQNHSCDHCYFWCELKILPSIFQIAYLHLIEKTTPPLKKKDYFLRFLNRTYHTKSATNQSLFTFLIFDWKLELGRPNKKRFLWGFFFSFLLHVPHVSQESVGGAPHRQHFYTRNKAGAVTQRFAGHFPQFMSRFQAIMCFFFQLGAKKRVLVHGRSGGLGQRAVCVPFPTVIKRFGGERYRTCVAYL